MARFKMIRDWLMLNDHSDKDLWQAFVKGDSNALDHMFRLHYKSLYRYGLKMYSDPEFVEDCIQHFFLYVYENRKKLTCPDNLKAYLFKSFRRRMMRQREKHKISEKRSDSYAQNLIHVQFTAEELLVREEEDEHIKNTLLNALNNLPSRQGEVIYLRYYDDLSINEIAEVLSITYQGAVNTIYKAMKSLRRDSSLRKNTLF